MAEGVKAEKKDDGLPVKTTITITFRAQDAEDIEIKAKPTTSIKKFIEAYCKQRSVNAEVHSLYLYNQNNALTCKFL